MLMMIKITNVPPDLEAMITAEIERRRPQPSIATITKEALYAYLSERQPTPAPRSQPAPPTRGGNVYDSFE